MSISKSRSGGKCDRLNEVFSKLIRKKSFIF